jgi:hypothetical protein
MPLSAIIPEQQLVDGFNADTQCGVPLKNLIQPHDSKIG